jgi:polyphenol oxidase
VVTRTEARPVDGTIVRISTRADGDAHDVAVRARLVDRPWATIHQVHGATVVTAADAEARVLDADAVISRVGDSALGVFGADCPLLAIGDSAGAIAAVHAGWRGLRDGVIAAAAAALRDAGAGELWAVLGPYIGPECYEFSPDDVAALERQLDCALEARTTDGAVALDLGAAVSAELDRAGITLVDTLGSCTACSGEFFSYRARRESERQVLGVYRDR